MFSCKQLETSDRKVLKFPIAALIDVTLFELVKATSCRGIMLTASGTNIGRIMAFCLKTFINFLASSCCNYLFPVPITILQIYDLIRKNQLLNSEPQIIVRIFCILCVNIDFGFLFLARCFFLLCLDKQSKKKN